MKLFVSIFSGLVSAGLVLALGYARAQLSATRTARDAWRERCDGERKFAADQERRADEWRSNAMEWRAQAIDMSRRNHELTELVASIKRQELLVNVDEEITDPPSVLEADAAVAESRRALAVSDRHVRPLATRPTNNDDEDDRN